MPATGMLETIRQFAEEQLAATGSIDDVRDRHARYFADQAVAHWDIWDGPRQRVAIDWVDVEFANLRAGFRWAADHGDLDTAAAIAAHTAMLGYALQRFEPVGWAEEILDAATAADVPQLPRLYTAASALLADRAPDDCRRLRPDGGRLGGRSPLRPVRARMAAVMWEAGRPSLRRSDAERCMEVCAGLAASPGSRTSSVWCATLLRAAASSGGPTEAMAIAEETVAAARAHGNPFWIAWRAHRVRAGLRRGRSDPSPGCPASGASPSPESTDWRTGRRIVVPGGRRPRSGPRRASSRPSRCSTRPSTRSTGPATSPTWPSRSPTWPCSSTASNDPRSPPPSTAPARRHGDIGWVLNLPAVVDHLRDVLGEPASTTASPPGRPWNSPTPCSTHSVRTDSLGRRLGRETAAHRHPRLSVRRVAPMARHDSPVAALNNVADSDADPVERSGQGAQSAAPAVPDICGQSSQVCCFSPQLSSH